MGKRQARLGAGGHGSSGGVEDVVSALLPPPRSGWRLYALLPAGAILAAFIVVLHLSGTVWPRLTFDFGNLEVERAAEHLGTGGAQFLIMLDNSGWTTADVQRIRVDSPGLAIPAVLVDGTIPLDSNGINFPDPQAARSWPAAGVSLPPDTALWVVLRYPHVDCGQVAASVVSHGVTEFLVSGHGWSQIPITVNAGQSGPYAGSSLFGLWPSSGVGWSQAVNEYACGGPGSEPN